MRTEKGKRKKNWGVKGGKTVGFWKRNRKKKLQLNPDKKPEKKIRAKKREKAEHKSKAIIHRERGKETEEKQGK